MNDKFLGNKIVFPSLKGPEQSILLFIISGVVEGGTMKLFTEIYNWLPPCNNTAPIPTPDASHSSSKVLKKSGKARTGALVTRVFIFWKAFSCFSPQWNVVKLEWRS